MGAEAVAIDLLIEAGLSVIPIKADKTPAVPSWKEFQSRLPSVGEMNYDGGAGLVCGRISGNVEAIDIDAKYDRTVIQRFQDQINIYCPEITGKLVIQQTPSAGMHLVYRCHVIQGNQKLASRHATSEELKANPHNKVRVLIETRGEGGYIAMPPTPGYEVLFGSFDDIQEITTEEREALFTAARSLNEVFEEIRQPRTQAFNTNYSNHTGIAPWEDFNQRADIDSLLLQHGWTRSGSHGDNEYYRRPDKDKGHSASYNKKLNLFYCFTSSTVLEPSKAYSPAALYSFLECNGDFSEAAKKLITQGYGVPFPFRQTDHSAACQSTARTPNSCILFRLTKDTPMEQPKKVFGTLWAHNENAIFFGEDGSCKTILAVQIGCNIATGLSTPGFPNELPPQPVALFDAELSDYQFNNRYPAGLPDNFKRFTFAEDQQKALIGARPEFVVEQIEAAAETINAKVLILDNLSALTSMLDLTKTTDSIQLMGLFNEMKKKGYSILIIDHTRKPMKEGEFKTIYKSDLQGSKMKSNLVDSVFSIGKSAQGEDIRYIKALKIRSYEMTYTKTSVATMQLKPDPLRLEFLGINAEWEHINDRNSEMMKMSSQGKTQAEIAKAFGVSQQAVSKFLRND